MRKVRVLVGTREGAFILTLDGKREKWDVSGPHFAGWDMYHLKASPVDPNRIYASQTSGWFGQSFNAPMTAARLGYNQARRRANRPALEGCPKARAISLFTTLPRRAGNASPLISSTMESSIHGSSSASGILNRRSPNSIFGSGLGADASPRLIQLQAKVSF
jgi:hypothetical protein